MVFIISVELPEYFALRLSGRDRKVAVIPVPGTILRDSQEQEARERGIFYVKDEGQSSGSSGRLWDGERVGKWADVGMYRYLAVFVGEVLPLAEHCCVCFCFFCFVCSWWFVLSFVNYLESKKGRPIKEGDPPHLAGPSKGVDATSPLVATPEVRSLN